MQAKASCHLQERDSPIDCYPLWFAYFSHWYQIKEGDKYPRFLKYRESLGGLFLMPTIEPIGTANRNGGHRGHLKDVQI